MSQNRSWQYFIERLFLHQNRVPLYVWSLLLNSLGWLFNKATVFGCLGCVCSATWFSKSELAVQKEARARGKSVSSIFCCYVLGSFFEFYFSISVEHPFIRISGSRGRYLVGAAREFSGVQHDAATSTA